MKVFVVYYKEVLQTTQESPKTIHSSFPMEADNLFDASAEAESFLKKIARKAEVYSIEEENDV